MDDWIFPSMDPYSLTYLGVKFHLPTTRRLIKGIQILLKFGVAFCIYSQEKYVKLNGQFNHNPITGILVEKIEY